MNFSFNTIHSGTKTIRVFSIKQKVIFSITKYGNLIHGEMSLINFPNLKVTLSQDIIEDELDLANEMLINLESDLRTEIEEFERSMAALSLEVEDIA